MQLYILRHADADTQADHDDDRHLSEKGIQQAQRLARFCEAHEIAPQLILSSPIRRAQQTAKVLAEHLRVELRTVRWLACGAQPETILAEIKEYSPLPSLLIVGHEPDLGHCISHLLGTTHSDAFHIRKASLTLVSIFEFQPAGSRLEFSIPPKLL